MYRTGEEIAKIKEGTISSILNTSFPFHCLNDALIG